LLASFGFTRTYHDFNMAVRTFATLIGTLLVASAAASFDNNLAYSSPSRRHNLGVPVSHLAKRQTPNLYKAAELNFTHGIASGDPLADSVILWTRLSPNPENVASDIVPEGVVPLHKDSEGAPSSDYAACVEYKVATDEALKNVVDKGLAYTSSEVDFTVKVKHAISHH
jgi:alkaline phosphatase D